MRVLVALTYYRPHVSGLTIYVQRLAEALAAAGARVTVLTSRYDPSLPRTEDVHGVRIVRVPVARRVGKGVVMPRFPFVAARLIRDADVVSVHLPQLEAGLLAALARGHPTVLTYHCDLQLPPGLLNRVVDRAAATMHRLAFRLADRIVAYTGDYAEHSSLLSRVRDKIVVIPPPVEMAPSDPAAVRAFEQRHALTGARRIGFAARLATEKGVEYLLDALPLVMKEFPRLRALFAGPYEDVVGESRYRRRLRPALERHAREWTFLGTVTPEDMPTFFAASDVTVLPSINSTESFGLVQVESMLCGTPVVASDLPGVRVPVGLTGMGEIVPPRDAAALAGAIVRVLRQPERYWRPRSEIEKHFSTQNTCAAYLELFRALA